MSDVDCRPCYGGVYARRWWSDALRCVVSCVTLGGVLTLVLFMVACCSMLSRGMIGDFSDLVSGEDGRMINSLEKFVITCHNEKSKICRAAECERCSKVSDVLRSSVRFGVCERF